MLWFAIYGLCWVGLGSHPILSTDARPKPMHHRRLTQHQPNRLFTLGEKLLDEIRINFRAVKFRRIEDLLVKLDRRRQSRDRTFA